MGIYPKGPQNFKWGKPDTSTLKDPHGKQDSEHHHQHKEVQDR
jgi:hypothetical protein